jgi:hypothetical protein
MATVNFDDGNEDRIPAAHRAEYQKVIKSLIDELRPVAETWTVVTHEQADETACCIDFTLSGRTESVDIARSGDDAQHHKFRRAVRYFLEDRWPTS